MGQLNHEPSMEDILASIKRIIAEDSEAVGARPPRLRREAMESVAASPVLATKRPKSSPPPASEVVEEPEPEIEAASDEPEAELTDAPEASEAPNDILELTSPMPEAASAHSATPVETPMPNLDGLMSTTTAVASRNAFAALSQLQVRADTGQENTLEGLVTDMLRPMLREWLDRELPAMVERLVAAEVARLSGRG
jgi:cell pole-organizing protein PopZ